jgi:hypothetical protein
MCSANINVHAHIYDNIIIKKKHMQNFIQKKNPVIYFNP